MHEWGTTNQLLAQILAQVQANAKPGERVTPISPATAQDVLDAETADFDEWLINEWMDEVSDDEYLAMAEAGLDDVRDAPAEDDGSVRVIALPPEQHDTGQPATE